MQQEKSTIIKPQLNNPLMLIASFIVTFFIWFFLGFWIGFGLFAFLGLATLLVIPFLFLFTLLIVFILMRKHTQATEYRFYSDRVEYFEGFLAKNRKTILYSRITNVSQRNGILERMFGLGTILLDTAGSSQQGNELRMYGLENSDQIYDWLIKLIQKK